MEGGDGEVLHGSVATTTTATCSLPPSNPASAPRRDKWNRLDFVLVMLSLLDLAISFLKAANLTPGTLIPIVPSANLVADAPDTLILFAWNFASEIIPRLRAQGYKGRIITPLPEVEVDEV